MIEFYSTRQVAQKILKIKPDNLQKAVWQNRVKAPSKGPSGQYLWTIPDIESASWHLRRHREFEVWRQMNALIDASSPADRKAIDRGRREGQLLRRELENQLHKGAGIVADHL